MTRTQKKSSLLSLSRFQTSSFVPNQQKDDGVPKTLRGRRCGGRRWSCEFDASPRHCSTVREVFPHCDGGGAAEATSHLVSDVCWPKGGSRASGWNGRTSGSSDALQGNMPECYQLTTPILSCFSQVPADVPEENLNYASVHFTKRSTEPLYSNVRAARKHSSTDEDRAEYTMIRLHTAST